MDRTHLRVTRAAFAAAACTALVALAAPVSAQTTTTATLDLTATVIAPTPTCSVTVPPVDVGTHEQGAGQVTVDFDITYSCTAPVASATATFDAGLQPVGTSYRRMGAPGVAVGLAYELFLGGTAGTLAGIDQPVGFSLTTGSSDQSWTVLINPSTGHEPATYKDQVTVTFTF